MRVVVLSSLIGIRIREWRCVPSSVARVLRPVASSPQGCAPRGIADKLLDEML